LLELIRGARESVYLVTFAAYKVPDVAEAIAAALGRGVRVVFVLESDSVSGGKVDFDPLPHLIDGVAQRVEVFVWPMRERRRDVRGRHGTLHAKFAVADRHRLLISSANLTADAFDLNIELGVLLSGGTAPKEAASQVDELIRLGVLQQAEAK
jgi:cardiolipin synthase A/B